MDCIALPAFDDNYIWLLHCQGQAVLVDPGCADVAQAALTQRGLKLAGILVTHHHADHTGGVAALAQAHGAPVFGPAREAMPCPHTPCREGDALTLADMHFDVLDVPGHTSGHIAFVARPAGAAPWLFCGDTLFSAGCGRIGPGCTPGQLYAALQKLMRLPPDTLVYCAHEYTLSNLRFALAVEPDNPATLAYQQHCQRLRAQNHPTLPARLGDEQAHNPFLRCQQPAVWQALRQQRQVAVPDEVAAFAALREWKNVFR